MLESRIKWNAQNRYILIEKDAYFSFHKANCEIALPSFSVKQFFITLLLWKVLWSFWFSQLTFKARQVLLHVEKKRKVDWKCNSAIKTINRVLSVIDPEKKLENLLDFVLIKEKILKLCWKRYWPETIKSYFTSLGHFYSFLLSEKPDEIQVSSELVTQVKERVRRWSSSHKRSSLQRKWERQEEERHELITPDKFVEFENSKASRDAVILLGKLSGTHNVVNT